MHLASFLNKVFKKGGFILIDANLKNYIIGKDNYVFLGINILLRSNKINIPKINKKLIKTNMIDKKIYG